MPFVVDYFILENLGAMDRYLVDWFLILTNFVCVSWASACLSLRSRRNAPQPLPPHSLGPNPKGRPAGRRRQEGRMVLFRGGFVKPPGVIAQTPDGSQELFSRLRSSTERLC